MATLAILVAAALPRLWAAWHDQGIFWPDEIHQSLEQAHRLTFGYGLVPWEYRDGARSWLLPGLIAGVWKGALLVGLDSSPVLVRLGKLFIVLLSLGGIWAGMEHARRRAGMGAALVAGLLAAELPPALMYGSRGMSEMASGPLVMFAVLLAWSRRPAYHYVAGVLAAGAVFMRYQNGLIWLGLAVAILVDQPDRSVRPRAVALRFMVASAAVAALFGAIDWRMWGQPFYTLYRYVEFNVSGGRAAAYWGAMPPSFFLTTMWSAVGPSLIPIVVGLVWARPRWPLAIVILYVAAHSFIAHKELRFIMPVVPLALSASACGLVQLCERLRLGPAPAVALALVLAPVMSLRAKHATFADFGQYVGHSRGLRSPWHADEGINRLLWNVGIRGDACGVAVATGSPAWTGGYTYLHKPIPMLWSSSASDRERANYIIAARDQRFDHYEVVRRELDVWLYRREGDCRGGLDRRDPSLP